MITQEEVGQVMAIMRKLAPALGKVPDDTLTAWIELAEIFVCRKDFKADYLKALALYTMHLAFMDGALKGENEDIENYSRRVTSFTLSGEFSQTFGTASRNNTNDQLLNTPWGKMFKALRSKKRGNFALLTGARRGCC